MSSRPSARKVPNVAEAGEKPLSPGKYKPEVLIAMFRLAVKLRREMLNAEFSDNGGAIHSAERILNILGLRLCYPGLSHQNKLRDYVGAHFSVKALAARNAGQPVYIEHVSPHRELTRRAADLIEAGVSDEEFAAFVRSHYKLALLTREETDHLNRLNRSKMDPRRLEKAGIRLVSRARLKPSKVSQLAVSPGSGGTGASRRGNRAASRTRPKAVASRAAAAKLKVA